ncbi:MAG: alpha/beta hydrolase [bacterium]|nr:alpha/beta hydrolase [bacterium]
MRQQPSRAGQNWIFDNFLKLSENEDILHPGVMGGRLERGFRYVDLQAVYSRVKGRRSFPKAWAYQAAKQEEFAGAHEEKGHTLTAAQHYHRAALCWARAMHLIPIHGNPRKVEWYAGLARCHKKFRELHGNKIEKHALEFEDGKSAYIIFMAAEGAGPKPTVLIIPGMDQVKEDNLNPWNNYFLQRGMNVCVMDGPGQGECTMNEVWVDHSNYARAASRVIDFLCEHPEVDAGRVGLFGMSMGSRWGVEIGAHDKRPKAVIGQMANVGPSDIIFNHAQPNFRRIYMYMANIHDEAAFDAFIEERDSIWLGIAEKLEANYLLVAGDMDELCPPEDIDVFMNTLKCPKEHWLYEGVFHPMGEVAADIYPAIADWMLDTLNGGLPKGHDKRIYVAEYI